MKNNEVTKNRIGKSAEAYEMIMNLIYKMNYGEPMNFDELRSLLLEYHINHLELIRKIEEFENMEIQNVPKELQIPSFIQ